MPSRTPEFKSNVETARLRQASAGGVPEHRQRLLAGQSSKDARAGQRSDFARSAASIAKDIESTMGKLEKLAQLAKRKTLFDDRPVEISELTYIIKRDIASLNQQISQLQSITQSGQGLSGRGRQAEEHSNNVVVMLQGKLASTSMGFKDVLEIRTQNMKASKARTDQFGYASNAGIAAAAPSVLRSRQPFTTPDSVLYQAAPAPIGNNAISNGRYNYNTGPNGLQTGPPDFKGKGRMSDEVNGSNDYLALDMGVGPSSAQEQMQLQVHQQDQYLGQRATAIESIESTISELGQIFSQLATMVAQQGETVQRIDADTSDIANNVSGAQRELLKYLASVSGNRWLMIKVFGILVIFFLLFTLVS